MKVIVLALAIFLSAIPLTAQELPEWYRVHTFEDSAIEMNTTLVTFRAPDIARVRFRWSFNQLQALSDEPKLKYRSRLEVIEFDCANRLFRPHEVTLFDAAGKIVRILQMDPPAAWKPVASAPMTEKLFIPACQLIKLINKWLKADEATGGELEINRVEKFTASFFQRLEQAKDFRPLIKEFFAPRLLEGYLQDKDTNWFLILNRETAAKASRAELQSFYFALLNTGYLGSLYIHLKSPSTPEPSVPDEQVFPPDFIRLVKNHPYTAASEIKEGNYIDLGDNIESVERLRSYTDLLGKMAASLRRHIIQFKAKQPSKYRMALAEFATGSRPQLSRICQSECLGLPKGTRLFGVNVSVFGLQLAEINGELKIVSAAYRFQ